MNRSSRARNLVLVTGLSGGGKSTALRALEDLGFYCVDNLPAAMLPEIEKQIGRRQEDAYARVAFGVDARSPHDELGQLPGWLDELESRGQPCMLLFMTAETRAIIKRFSETRRRHPLTGEQQALPQAIETEKSILEPLHARADWVIDTSDLNVHQLRNQVWRCVGDEDGAMTIVLESFAFKRGVPQGVDFIFDARILPNPYWVQDLRDHSGLEEPVKTWLEKDDSVKRMIDDITAFLLNWLPEFQNSQRSYVTIGVGCTGGFHRSVYLIERLAGELESRFGNVLVYHRELQS